ncbi:M28 family metallopeptidase [Streptomyces sp. SudanB52_2052]|uniref:M28 family metallopeptidase n=1 Tax=Streptomyces sp. SudanB52_2052 TaxID=3035276 RepID=UPI003F567DC8
MGRDVRQGLPLVPPEKGHPPTAAERFVPARGDKAGRAAQRLAEAPVESVSAEDPRDAEARAPGADDNAGGVAAVIEIARLLAPVARTSTIRFVAFSGEEQGLWGSSAYADELRAAGAGVHRVVHLDMVGRPPADGSVTVERDAVRGAGRRDDRRVRGGGEPGLPPDDRHPRHARLRLPGRRHASHPGDPARLTPRQRPR